MGRDIIAGAAYVVLGVKNRVDKGLKDAEKKLKKWGKTATATGGAIAGGVGALLAAPVKLASDMEETMSKFGVVFGDSADSMKQWSDATASAIGVSRQEMAAMTSGMQDLLVPMGVMPGTAMDMTKQLSQLAVDLGSFNNLGVDQTFGDLMSALTGSGDVMKKYGVVLNETILKQELMNMGMDPKNATEAQKAQARMNVIMKGTTAAQGDAIRTADGFANQVKRVYANIKDLLAVIGKPLLEPLAAGLSIISKLTTKVFDWAQANEKLVKMVGYVLLGVGGFGVVLATVGGLLTGVGFAFGALASAIGFLTSPIMLVVGGMGVLATAFFKYSEYAGDAIDWLKDQFKPLYTTVSQTLTRVMEAFATSDLNGAWDAIVEGLELTWMDLTDGMRAYWDEFMNWMVEIGTWAAKGVGKAFESLGGIIKTMLDGYGKYYNKIWNMVVEAGGSMSGVRTIGGPVDAFGGGGSVGSAISKIGSGIEQFGATMQSSADDIAKQSMANRARAAEARKRRMDELRGIVSNAADEAEASAEARKKLGDVPTVDDALKNAKDSAGKVSDSASAGTFSSFGAMFMGGQTFQARQLRAAEATAKATQAMAARQKKDRLATFG